jgi:hypothetical protein
MTNKHNHLINEALNSVEGIQRAEASPFLYGKIIERLKQQLPEPIYYSGKVIVRFALAMLVIGSINALTVRIVKQQTTVPQLNEQMELNRLAQEYFGFENTNAYTY